MQDEYQTIDEPSIGEFWDRGEQSTYEESVKTSHLLHLQTGTIKCARIMTTWPLTSRPAGSPLSRSWEKSLASRLSNNAVPGVNRARSAAANLESSTLTSSTLACANNGKARSTAEKALPVARASKAQKRLKVACIRWDHPNQ